MVYDSVIIGAGPAGLSAAIYGARYLLKQLVIGEMIGGMITSSHLVDNYPALPGVAGWELGQKFEQHARDLGVEIVFGRASALTLLPDGLWQVEVGRDVYQSKTVILANGLVWRKLGVPGEEKLIGKGVSYCATCDGAFYRDQLVGVVGGSDAACESALYLADLAEQVYIIYRKSALRAEPIVVQAVLENPKIQVVYDTIISKINGSDQLESVALEKIDGSTRDLGLDGLFIEIGAQPGIDFAQDLEIETDEQGYIAVDSQQRTSLPGLYAAGDLTTNSGKFQQVVTAASEGAVAMMTLYRDLMTKA